MDKKNIARIKKALLPLAFLAFFLAFWEWLASTAYINHLILPSFSAVLATAIANGNELLFHLGITSLESILGFAIGAGVAFLAAALFVYSENFKNTFLPFAIALKATPLFALAPLLILWFGNDLTSKIVMGALVAFFPVLINSLDGLTKIEKEKLHLFKLYSANKLQTLIKLRVPHSLPFVFSSLKIASTLSVVGVVIAEFTGATQGLGHIVVISSYYLETPLMFAAVILISLWGILLYGMVAFLEQQFSKKKFGLHAEN